MIYRCTSCQHETPAGLPPKPAKPEACEKCGAAVTGVHDTEPPLPPDEMPGGYETQESKGPKPKLLISTMVYALAHELGAEAATAELHRQIDELAGPFSGHRDPSDYLPVAYLIARAMRVFDVGLYVDAGATQIGKARCRAMAHAMAHPEFPVWLSVDDDVECTVPTLLSLYEAVSNGAPSIAIAPCFLRGVPLVNVAFPSVVVERTLVGADAKLRTALYGGFGLVAMSQEALTRVSAASALWFVDDDGKRKPAVFSDYMQTAEGKTDDVRWFGEDLSFFLRVPRSVRVEALLTGYTRHAGETLNLSRLEEYETFKATPEWLAAQSSRHPKEATERKVLAVEPKQVTAPPPKTPEPAPERAPVAVPSKTVVD